MDPNKCHFVQMITEYFATNISSLEKGIQLTYNNIHKRWDLPLLFNDSIL